MRGVRRVAGVPAMAPRGTAGRDDPGSIVELMRQWVDGGILHHRRSAEHFLGRDADDPIVTRLRAAIGTAPDATRHDELRVAASAMAEARLIVGLDRWPRFLADAETRANDLETRSGG